MKQKTLIILAVAAVLLYAVTQSLTSKNINTYVYDVDGTPLYGAEMHLVVIQPEPDYEATAYTSGAGKASFTDLDARSDMLCGDSYTLTASYYCSGSWCSQSKYFESVTKTLCSSDPKFYLDFNYGGGTTSTIVTTTTKAPVQTTAPHSGTTQPGQTTTTAAGTLPEVGGVDPYLFAGIIALAALVVWRQMK